MRTVELNNIVYGLCFGTEPQQASLSSILRSGIYPAYGEADAEVWLPVWAYREADDVLQAVVAELKAHAPYATIHDYLTVVEFCLHNQDN